MIDWRGVICDFLRKPNGSTNDEIFDALDDVKHLKSKASTHSNSPKFQVIHQIQCAINGQSELYEDPPWVVQSGPYLAHLRGSHEIRNLELYLEQNKDITSIVYRQFECCRNPPPTHDPTGNRTRYDMEPDDLMTMEYISIVSEELQSSLVELAHSALKGILHPDFENGTANQIAYPYLWWFHRRVEIETAKSQLGPNFQRQISAFQDYLESSFGDEWTTVDSLISQKQIKAEYISYLFVRAIVDIPSSHKYNLLTNDRFHMKYASRSGRAAAPLE